MSAIWDKVSDASARQYDYLGANDVLELVDKSDLEINQEKFIDLFGVVFSTIPTVFFAWLVINTKWISYLSNQARYWAWNVGDDQVSDQPAVNSKTYAFPNRVWQYLLGALGFGMVLGSTLSVAIVPFISILRMPKQILTSFFDGFGRVIIMALPNGTLQPLNVDRRHIFLKFLGLPGALLGGLVATPFALVIVSCRVVTNLFKIPYHSFISGRKAYNDVIYQVSERKSESVESDPDKRDFLEKYVLGLPGMALGGLLGSLVALPILMTRTLVHSSKTFAHLSKTYLNTAFERDIFENGGIYRLRGLNAHLGFGAPGIILSLPVGLLAVTIGVLRYTGPAVMGTLMLVPSIVRRVLDEGFKGFSGAWRLARKPSMLNDEQHQVFRIIYANKNAIDGRLPENTLLHVPPEGGFNTESGGGFWYNILNGKNILKFIRKVFTFNAQTLHEEALDRIYRHLNYQPINATSEKVDPSIRKRQILERKLDSLTPEIEAMQRQDYLSYYAHWRLEGLLEKQTVTRKAIGFIERETAIRTNLENDRKADAISMAITLAVDELKQTYRYKSSFMMSTQQKNDNDKELDQLRDFIIDELEKVGDTPRDMYMPSAPSMDQTEDPEDGVRTQPSQGSSEELLPSYAVATRDLYVHRNRFFGQEPPPAYSRRPLRGDAFGYDDSPNQFR